MMPPIIHNSFALLTPIGWSILISFTRQYCRLRSARTRHANHTYATPHHLRHIWGYLFHIHATTGRRYLHIFPSIPHTPYHLKMNKIIYIHAGHISIILLNAKWRSPSQCTYLPYRAAFHYAGWHYYVYYSDYHFDFDKYAASYIITLMLLGFGRHNTWAE